ncbi:hypothetical protein M0802_012401 [Mischocyttarus mexicanus]|nr:hypothetical protein M0802_012401 [Mischocyttarus mexicanus]
MSVQSSDTAFETHPGSVTSVTTGQISESTTSSGKRVAAAHRKTNAAICNPPGSERSSPQDGQPNFNVSQSILPSHQFAES